jgi:hypothetical protein
MNSSMRFTKRRRIPLTLKGPGRSKAPQTPLKLGIVPTMFPDLAYCSRVFLSLESES